MTIQSQLDQIAINILPKIKSAIEAAEKFEANQMINRVLRECMNSSKAIDSMNESELNSFQDEVLETFKYNEWMK